MHCATNKGNRSYEPVLHMHVNEQEQYLLSLPIHLSVIQPATVSRCGMVYLEPSSFGWRPLLSSWMNSLPAVLKENHRELIQALFDWIVEPCLVFVRKQIKVRTYVRTCTWMHVLPMHLCTYACVHLYTPCIHLYNMLCACVKCVHSHTLCVQYVLYCELIVFLHGPVSVPTYVYKYTYVRITE